MSIQLGQTRAQLSIVAKGDLQGFAADYARVPIGSADWQVLTTASASSTNLAYFPAILTCASDANGSVYTSTGAGVATVYFLNIPASTFPRNALLRFAFNEINDDVSRAQTVNFSDQSIILTSSLSSNSTFQESWGSVTAKQAALSPQTWKSVISTYYQNAGNLNVQGGTSNTEFRTDNALTFYVTHDFSAAGKHVQITNVRVRIDG